MRKLLCVFLAAALAALCLVPAFAEEAPAQEASVRPVIVIPGICESMLVLDKGTENETRYYQPVTWIFDDVKKDLIVGAIKALFLFSYKQLTEAGIYLGGESIKLIAVDEQGRSVNNISPAVVGAAESSYAAIRRNGRWGAVDHGAHIVPFIAERVGDENVFFFCYDWRLGAITLADQLKDFIGEVLAQRSISTAIPTAARSPRSISIRSAARRSAEFCSVPPRGRAPRSSATCLRRVKMISVSIPARWRASFCVLVCTSGISSRF